MEEEIERYLDEMEFCEIEKPSRSCDLCDTCDALHTVFKIAKDVGFIIGGGLAVSVLTVTIWTFKFLGVEDDTKRDFSKKDDHKKDKS